MKKLILLSALFAVLSLLPACATFKSNAGKTLSSTALTVDAAMKGWAAYVVMNNVPAEKQTPVRLAYGQYQSAMLVARDAYVTLATTGDKVPWNTAASALANSASKITALITQMKGTP